LRVLVGVVDAVLRELTAGIKVGLVS